jgi:hypothetical protein
MNCRFKELECPGSKPSDTERKRRAMQLARAICIEEKPPALVVARNLSPDISQKEVHRGFESVKVVLRRTA